MAELDTNAYLRRLTLPDPGPPSAQALRALHAAHVERVAYEALEIQLGRPTTLDPHESAERIVARRRGGYCYHLNGAFSLLLAGLGYDVVWHRAGVQNHADPGPVGAGIANHLTLTVHGLPAPDCPSGDWLVDVGLGDALHGPLPLRAGGPLPLPAPALDGRARRVAPRPRPARELRRHGLPSGPGDHRRLRRAPRVPLHAVFGLPLTDLGPDERDALWTRVRATHDAWLAARAS